MTGREGRGSDVRRRLVDAGVQSLRQVMPERIVSAVGTREIARRAGVSQAAFFYHFPDLASYAEAVLDAVFPLDRSDEVELITGAIRIFAAANRPAEVGKLLFEGGLAQRAGDPTFRTRLGLWALGGAALDDRYRRFFAVADEPAAWATAAVFDTWRRELRAPLDLDGFVRYLSALQLGAAIRQLVDREGFDVGAYAAVTTATTAAVLRRPDDRRSMADQLAELNYFPGEAKRAAGRTRATATRERVLDAAGELFDDHGIDQVSIALVSRRAGVSPATVYSLFQSKDGIAGALLGRRWRARRPAPPDAADGDLDATGELRDHLGLVGVLARERRDLGEVYAAALARRSPAVGDCPIRAHTGALVARCRREGAVASALGDGDLGDLLLTVVLGCANAARHGDAAASADLALRLLAP